MLSFLVPIWPEDELVHFYEQLSQEPYLLQSVHSAVYILPVYLVLSSSTSEMFLLLLAILSPCHGHRMVKRSLASHPLALCNDGTPAAYYYR